MNIEQQTYTYKRVGDCEINADVHRRRDHVVRPAIVWIHGGALIMGHRENINERQRDLYVNAGYTVISIDYRLAPKVKLGAIIEDVQDALRWVREDGPALFHVAPGRIAVVGHSGGGYLALITGFRVEPRPQALVSFYGYGDITGEWYSRPDPFYCRAALVSREEAYAAVGGPVISEARGPHRRDRFYLYCRQHGRWPQEVTGHDPHRDPQAFDQYCPARNVTADYPPALLLHGTADTDVPYEQSVMMAEALARAGVEHELLSICDGGHGFDGADTPDVTAIFRRVLAFLEQHLA